MINERTPLYLDYQATTPADPRVVDAMLPYFGKRFGNPHSVSHPYGWEAADAVEIARGQVAALIGATAREIVFTSGATEANNLALKGVARAYAAKKNHIVTLATEHKCVLATARRLEREGFRVTYLPVDKAGLIDLAALDAAITKETVLVSVMGVNNEIGVIQPLAEIGRLARARGAFFHTDCAQAAGKIPLDVEAMKIDLMSLSAHKMYGPKGIGALYVRRRPRVRLVPEMDGGGQEEGLRSGTLPAPLAVGFGRAAEIAVAEMDAEASRLQALRARLYERISRGLSGVRVNGDLERRVPGNLNLSFADVTGENLMLALKDIALSSGAACASASKEPSHVLAALGLAEAEIESSLRIGLGRFTSESDVDYAAGRIREAVTRLRTRDAADAAPETRARIAVS
ncbi:MAG: IscS subfamily cysteine desulfurase [Rhodospirillales bacterium]|nr:IscS subfamily cysteine desulfurase [Rhodospirillales bacterium]